MRTRTRRAGITGVLAVALVAPVLVAPVVVAPTAAHASDDVSWSDVKKAKRNADRKAAEIVRISAVLRDVQGTAARAEQASITAAAASSRAEHPLAAAERTVRGLRKEAKRADRVAGSAEREAGTVAMQLSRVREPALVVWLAGGGSRAVLHRLTTLESLSRSSSALIESAAGVQRRAAAARARAAAATEVRDRLAVRARTAARRAERAERAADDRAAATAHRTVVLKAQLRALKGTYREVRSDYDQQRAEKAAAAAAGDGSATEVAGRIRAGSRTPDAARAYAEQRLAAFDWGARQGTCLGWLWYRESGWRWNAYNTSSGAYGIPQSLPAGKMASAGADWRTNATTQIDWGLGYIKTRYGSPCEAWAHETDIGWY